MTEDFDGRQVTTFIESQRIFNAGLQALSPVFLR